MLYGNGIKKGCYFQNGRELAAGVKLKHFSLYMLLAEACRGKVGTWLIYESDYESESVGSSQKWKTAREGSG